MKTRLFVFLALSLSFLNLLHAQSPKIIKGRVLVDDVPTAGVLLVFAGHGNGMSDANGEFVKELSTQDQTGFVKVSVQDARLYMLTPYQGFLPIPENKQLVLDITLTTNPEAKKSMDRLKKDMNNKIDSLARNFDYSLKDFRQEIEKVITTLYERQKEDYLVLQMNAIKEYELMLMVEKEVNKRIAATVIPEIDSVFDFYITRAKDLKDVFRDYSDKIFFNDQAIYRFNKTIDDYNIAYELLNSRQGRLTSLVELNWDGTAQLQLKYLLDKALQNVHKEKALLANHYLKQVDDINSRLTTRRRKKDVISDMELFAKDLELRIDALEVEKKRVTEYLKNQS